MQWSFTSVQGHALPDLMLLVHVELSEDAQQGCICSPDSAERCNYEDLLRAYTSYIGCML